jgi:NAD-dependent dihydropyrimidine dehydrogenase PreA subunit
VVSELHADAVEVVEVPDLCEWVERADPRVGELARGEALMVIACHPRAVRGLFADCGAPLPSSARIVDMRNESAASIAAAVKEACIRGKDVCAAGDDASALTASETDAWFPVIDRERCIDCGKCFDFCLFGVYTRSSGGVVAVTNPSACKTDCPACARICPENAIIFPKSTDEAINGAELDRETLKNARIRLNPEDMLRGDVYSRLKARMSGRHRSLFKPGVLEDEHITGTSAKRDDTDSADMPEPEGNP